MIVHFYNSTSTLQRKVVFGTDMEGVTQIAVEGAKLIRALTQELRRDHPETRVRFEYSPESFSGTEPENAVMICDRVLEALGATPEEPAIVNLPNTVEMSTPQHLRRPGGVRLPQPAPPGQRRHQRPPPQRPGHGGGGGGAGLDGRGPAGEGTLLATGSAPATWT